VSGSNRGGAARLSAVPARRGSTRRLPAPSLRSLAIGIAIVGLAAGAYAAALETSLFAVRTISIRGGSPRVQAEVRRALAPDLGTSLMRVGGGEIDRQVARIPDVISVRFDRQFPHTLGVVVRAEHGVLLLRQGSKSWLVSARGRVMRPVANPRRSTMPRMWLGKGTTVKLGETLPAADGTLAAAAVAPIAPGLFPGGVQSVIVSSSELTLVLRKGPQIRLGDVGNLRLKLVIAKRIMRIAASDQSSAAPATYIDVSVPGRPVLGTAQP
jgi:POTRA domain, FtsQ-type